jgi:hypothetical protein
MRSKHLPRVGDDIPSLVEVRGSLIGRDGDDDEREVAGGVEERFKAGRAFKPYIGEG